MLSAIGRGLIMTSWTFSRSRQIVSKSSCASGFVGFNGEIRYAEGEGDCGG